MAQTFHDPEFGAMTYDGFCWMLDERHARFNGIEVPLGVDPEDEASPFALSELQRAALRLALTLPDDAYVDATPYAMQVFALYQDAIGEEDLPTPQPATEVWKDIALRGITIVDHRDLKTPCFLLWADVEWDPEHGLEIAFRNGLPFEAGPMAEIRIEDD